MEIINIDMLSLSENTGAVGNVEIAPMCGSAGANYISGPGHCSIAFGCHCVRITCHQVWRP